MKAWYINCDKARNEDKVASARHETWNLRGLCFYPSRWVLMVTIPQEGALRQPKLDINPVKIYMKYTSACSPHGERGKGMAGKGRGKSKLVGEDWRPWRWLCVEYESLCVEVEIEIEILGRRYEMCYTGWLAKYRSLLALTRQETSPRSSKYRWEE